MTSLHRMTAARPSVTTPEMVVSAVCAFYGVERPLVPAIGRTRRSRLEPMRTACLLMRELTTLSLAEIGEQIGGRDHTTVLHALRCAANEAQVPDVAARVAALRRQLTGGGL